MAHWEDPEDAEELADMATEDLVRLQGRLNRQAEMVARELRKRMPGMARHNAEMALKSLSDEQVDRINGVLDAALKGRPAAKKPRK